MGGMGWKGGSRGREYMLTYSWFPGGSDGKKSACNAGDLGSIPGLGRYPGEANSHPLQYPGLENSMDCIARGVHKESQLSDSLSGKIFHAAEQLSPSELCCSAWEPKLLRPQAATVEAQCPRAHAPQQERPPQWETCTPQLGSSPCSLRVQKSLHSNGDPV